MQILPLTWDKAGLRKRPARPERSTGQKDLFSQNLKEGDEFDVQSRRISPNNPNRKQTVQSSNMPIGAQSKSKKPAIATPPASSATQFVAPRQKSIHQAAVVVPDFNNNNDKPPSYDEANEEAQIPTKLVTPTSEHDLQYFAAVSSGGTPEISASNSKLVLHLFRTTQTHIFPIEERLALGASSSNPFYALRSALGSTSVDEYNKLTLTRRWPRTDVWQTVVVSEIAPRLKLLATGQMLISRLRIEGRQARVQDIFELWWDSQTGSYHVWRNKEIPELEICCEGWGSLDEVPRTGALVVRRGVHQAEKAAIR